MHNFSRKGFATQKVCATVGFNKSTGRFTPAAPASLSGDTVMLVRKCSVATGLEIQRFAVLWRHLIVDELMPSNCGMKKITGVCDHKTSGFQAPWDDPQQEPNLAPYFPSTILRCSTVYVSTEFRPALGGNSAWDTFEPP